MGRACQLPGRLKPRSSWRPPLPQLDEAHATAHSGLSHTTSLLKAWSWRDMARPEAPEVTIPVPSRPSCPATCPLLIVSLLCTCCYSGFWGDKRELVTTTGSPQGGQGSIRQAHPGNGGSCYPLISLSLQAPGNRQTQFTQHLTRMRAQSIYPLQRLWLRNLHVKSCAHSLQEVGFLSYLFCCCFPSRMNTSCIPSALRGPQTPPAAR